MRLKLRPPNFEKFEEEKNPFVIPRRNKIAKKFHKKLYFLDRFPNVECSILSSSIFVSNKSCKKFINDTYIYIFFFFNKVIIIYFDSTIGSA